MSSEQTVIAATFSGVFLLFFNKIKGIIKKKQIEYIRNIKRDIVKAKIAQNKSIEALKEVKLEEMKIESEIVASIQDTQSIIDEIYKNNEERIKNTKIQIAEQQKNKLKHLRNVKIKSMCDSAIAKILQGVQLQGQNIETESLGKAEIMEIKKYFE